VFSFIYYFSIFYFCTFSGIIIITNKYSASAPTLLSLINRTIKSKRYHLYHINNQEVKSRGNFTIIMRTANFHPSLSTTAAITRNMTSSFVALFTTFLVVTTLLLPTIKVGVSSATNAKQVQHIPHHHSRIFRTADDHRTFLPLSRRRALSTTVSSVNPSLTSTNVPPVSTFSFWKLLFLFSQLSIL
jgi:hypothetical protein